jgi:hypothetical protein
MNSMPQKEQTIDASLLSVLTSDKYTELDAMAALHIDHPTAANTLEQGRIWHIVSEDREMLYLLLVLDEGEALAEDVEVPKCL